MTGDGKHSTPQTWLSLGMMMMMMADGFPQMLRLEDGRTLSDYNIQKARSPTPSQGMSRVSVPVRGVHVALGVASSRWCH
jgi:hypothetical protein